MFGQHMSQIKDMIEAAVPDPEAAQLAVMRKRAGDLLASGVLEGPQQLICKEVVNTEVQEMEAFMQRRALNLLAAQPAAGTGMGTGATTTSSIISGAGTQLAAGGSGNRTFDLSHDGPGFGGMSAATNAEAEAPAADGA